MPGKELQMNGNEMVQILQKANETIETLQGAYEVISALADARKEEIESLQAQLAESQRRERAAVEDMKLIVDAVREAHCDETCCFACAFDCDTSINDSGVPNCECPGFERDDCFEWRGPQEARKGE
jgi:hypothetical protein